MRFPKLSLSDEFALRSTAAELGVNPDSLYRLIDFETARTWNPMIKNKNSSARGLIQFTDATAVGLGFADSLDLVTQYPTIVDQLIVVKRYLSQFKPFPNDQSLYMSVFYPAARNWAPGREFPFMVQRLNPGIKTVADYVNKVNGDLSGASMVAAVVVGGILLYIIYKLF